jgi:hypothetical protein
LIIAESKDLVRQQKEEADIQRRGGQEWSGPACSKQQVRTRRRAV